jgi:hypothetical protein
MKISPYYKKAVLPPSLLVLFFSVVYTLIGLYKSDWSIEGSAGTMSFIGPLFYVLLMCILSLTIFLNKIRRLRKSLLWNILGWFLLPVGYLAFVLINDISNRIFFDFGFGHSFIYLLIMTLPFVVSLIISFIRYRQNIISS